MSILIKKNINPLYVFLFLFVFSSNIVQADLTKIVGTKVSVFPPKDFTSSLQFSGFEHTNSGSSIMITEIPGPVLEVGKGLTKEGLASRGMILIEKNNIIVNSKEAKLLKIRQYAGSVEYLKWLLLLGDASSSVLVTGTFPVSVDKTIGLAIKKSLQTTIWDKNEIVGLFDGLAFRVRESEELKYSKRMSNMVILGRYGEFGQPSLSKPLLIAGSPISQDRIDNISAFSKQNIYQMAKMEDIKFIRESDIKIGGHPAYEIVANAKNQADGTPMMLYQVIIPNGSNYIMIYGQVGKSISEKYIKQFREVANSTQLIGVSNNSSNTK